MDGPFLSPYTCKYCIVFKQFDGLKFDTLAGKHRKCQNFPPSKFCYNSAIIYSSANFDKRRLSRNERNLQNKTVAIIQMLSKISKFAVPTYSK